MLQKTYVAFSSGNGIFAVVVFVAKFITTHQLAVFEVALQIRVTVNWTQE